jgi:hypothetical protein
LRLHWLVLQRDMVDVCLKDPGFPVDCILTGGISTLVDVYLGHVTWRDARRSALSVEGDREVVDRLERWLRLDRAVGRELPIVPPRSE